MGFPNAKLFFCDRFKHRFLRSLKFPKHTIQFHNGCYTRTTRTLHTSAPLLGAKLLSVDELFARKSLQEHLKKIQSEYNQCLQAVNHGGAEEQCREEEMRTRRSKLSQMVPLIQNIMELDTKYKEMAENEALLKGQLPRNILTTFIHLKQCTQLTSTLTKSQLLVFSICFFVFFLSLMDEDPALKELAELEKEECLQHIQDLREKVHMWDIYFNMNK